MMLRPELEALAQFHVTVYTAGMDDRADQMASAARIRALPEADRLAVRARVEELSR